MKERSGAEPEVISMTAMSSATPQLAQVKQSEQCSKDENALEGPCATLNGSLKEAEPVIDDENEHRTRKSRLTQRRPMRCQVDGCGADLAQARKYFQRYRVCEWHLKAPSLQMDGRSVRFCDQCSKFHEISMFEGCRRTCNEKLERTRQARSDKRRQQTEQAERNDSRTNSGPLEVVSGQKRQHDEGPGYNEKYTQADSGYVPVLSKRTCWPPVLATSVTLAATSTSCAVPVSMLSSVVNQADTQGVLAVHRAALAAVGTGGSATGGVQVHLSGHGHGHANQGIGNYEGGSGGGGASSRSSWDDGHPHLQLLRMDSVTSRPGGMDSSQGHSMGTRNGGAGSIAVAALENCDPADYLHAHKSGEVPCIQRVTGPGAGVATGSQAAVLLQELYGIGGGEIRIAVGRGVHSGSDGGLVATRGVGNVLDARSGVEGLLPDTGGRLAVQRGEARHIDHAPLLQGRIGNGGWQYENGRGAGAGAGMFLFPAATAITEQRLVTQLQAPMAEGSRAGARVVMLHSEHRVPPGAGTDTAGIEIRCRKDDLYRHGHIAPPPVTAANDNVFDDGVDEAIAAALRAVIASLVSRRSTVRPQHDTIAAAVARLVECKQNGEAMAAAELLSTLRAFRGSTGPIPSGNSNAATVVDCWGGVCAPSHAAAAGRAMPVLDLAADAHVPAPSLGVPQMVSAGIKPHFGNGPGGSGADSTSSQVQRLHQQLMLQLTQTSESTYSTPRLGPHLFGRQQPLKQQQHVTFSQASPPDVEQQVQLVLGMGTARGSTATAAASEVMMGRAGAAAVAEAAVAAAAPPTPPQVHRLQLDGTVVQHEFQGSAATSTGTYHRNTYGTCFELAAPQVSTTAADGVGIVVNDHDVSEFRHLQHLLGQLVGVQVLLH
ncbi:hypothetical protein Vafri_6958 [Volvox africanus]|uniref:SBP-type domain-containing protein n=1 Tax=Volvox africanus TaxID=51714 RepID=A0A8J4B172_9CHLO|nr:hypothetical protein Vafri_6958 [Volvox africanus]